MEIGIASRFEKQKIPLNQMIFWIIQYVGRIEEWSKNMLSNTNSWAFNDDKVSNISTVFNWSSFINQLVKCLWIDDLFPSSVKFCCGQQNNLRMHILHDHFVPIIHHSWICSSARTEFADNKATSWRIITHADAFIQVLGACLSILVSIMCLILVRDFKIKKVQSDRL